MVIVAPLVSGNHAHRLLMLAFTVPVFITGVWAMWIVPRVRYLAIGLAVFAVGALVLDVFDPDQPALRALLVFTSAFLGLAIYRVLRRVMRLSTVTEDSLFGAASVYLMLGLGYSSVYYVIWKSTPSAFYFDAARAFGERGWPDFVYFSFTTLTTVAYGDITPAAPVIRSLCILEAITGVFFIAVIISRLVSLYKVR